MSTEKTTIHMDDATTCYVYGADQLEQLYVLLSALEGDTK